MREEYERKQEDDTDAEDAADDTEDGEALAS
jgi:hypothetical protein